MPKGYRDGVSVPWLRKRPYEALYKFFCWKALRKGKTNELTYEQFAQLVPMDCFYCGRESQAIAHNPGRRGHNAYCIDRLDNTQGYTSSNSVSCCGTCNMAKHTLGFDAFVEWVQRAYTHLQSKGVVGSENKEH